MTDPIVIAALSGGGAKSAAHVGALKALEERHLQPAHYVGTSMGAVVGACFAAGLSYDDVLHGITTISRSDVASLSASVLMGPFAPGLLRSEPLKETIAALVPAARFSDLEYPLTVTAVDLQSGKLVLFGEGGHQHIPLVDALYASCALPVYYPPARIGDRLYVDGGLRSVLPLDVAGRFDPDVIFAVSIGPSLYTEPRSDGSLTPALLRAHNEALRVLMAVQTEEEIGRWKSARAELVLVQPHLGAPATFALANVVEFIEEGYRSACRALAASQTLS